MSPVRPSDNFQDQMKRELSYREEMVQQLHIVRGEKNKAEAAETAAPSAPAVGSQIYWSIFTDVTDASACAQRTRCMQTGGVCLL